MEVFPPNELLRVVKTPAGGRAIYHGRLPVTREERIALRHRSIQLLPAMTSRAVVILEGPYDRAAWAELASRLFYEENRPLPSAHRVSIIDAGSIDGSGGASAIPRLAAAAGEVGLRSVAVLDHDRPSIQTEKEVKENLSCADAVVRLPVGHAIELALLTGLPEELIKRTLTDLSKAFGVGLPANLETLTDKPLLTAARTFLKQGGGLHGQFVAALPAGILPPVARLAMLTAVDVAVKAATGALTDKACIDL
jgi:putative ATP-dependent endonuclease of the OLD family